MRFEARITTVFQAIRPAAQRIRPLAAGSMATPSGGAPVRACSRPACRCRRLARLALLASLLLAGAVAAADTLRVGNQVLVSGDSSERVLELLGKPDARAREARPKPRQRGTRQRRTGMRVIGRKPGVRWSWHRDGRTTVVTLVEGRVVAIEERR